MTFFFQRSKIRKTFRAPTASRPTRGGDHLVPCIYGFIFREKWPGVLCVSQSSVPSRNSEPDEADEPDEPDELETVSATAAPTSPVIAPGARITAVSKQTPSNYPWIAN